MAPGRPSRKKTPTPVPAIPTGLDMAYGSRGVPELHAQTRQGGRDFDADFAAARQASTAPAPSVVVEEEVDAAPSPPKRGGRSSRVARSGSQSAAPEERAEERAPAAGRRRGPIPERSGTNLSHGAHYQAANGDEHAEIREPNSFRVFARALPRYIRALLQIANGNLKDLFIFTLFVCCGVISFMTMMAYAPLPSAMASVRDDLCWGLKLLFRIDPYNVPPTELQETWYQFQHAKIFSKALPTYNMPDLQWSININFLQRIERAEARIDQVEATMKGHEETMTMIQEMLPPHVLVRVVDGRYVIPEEFWQALQERLGEDSDMAPLWQSYIQRNEREIEHLNQQLVSLALDRTIEEHQIVSREKFTELVEENNKWLLDKLDKEFDDWQQDHIVKLKEIAAHTATDVVKKSPLGQVAAREKLSSLLQYNQLYNSYIAIRSINWFAPTLGARVDPQLTSPTQQPPSKSWFEALFRRYSPTVIGPNPPIAALTPWQEQKECWCAAKSPDGKSQIAVITSKKIFPDKLVIEHIPYMGTNDIKSAPYDIEVWADAGSKKAAEKVAKLIEEVEHFYFTKKCDAPPWPTYVCIGRGRYDVHYENYVQPIQLVKSTEEMAVGVNKFIVRVNENWGGNYTCLYRLRMTGEELG